MGFRKLTEKTVYVKTGNETKRHKAKKRATKRKGKKSGYKIFGFKF